MDNKENDKKVYKVICGDCLKELKNIASSSVNLIFCDPPYWLRVSKTLKRVEGTIYDGCHDLWDNQFNSLTEYEEFTRRYLTECCRILTDNGSIWVIGSFQCIYTIGAIMQELGFWIINDVVWNKLNPTPNFTGSRLTNGHETLIWATKSPNAKYTFHYKTAKELNSSIKGYSEGIRKQLGSVWSFSLCSGNERLKDENGKKLHSTQKPASLLYRIINISSNLGDLVLDPFSGSFTTGAVALQCGRQFIGIESDKKYCDYGIKRLENTTIKIGDIERASFDKKEVKVSFLDLIKAKYLLPGEKLFLADAKTSCLLNGDGRVLIDKDNKITDIHTAAALLSGKKAARVNGFDYWYVVREGRIIGINEVRKEYRKTLIS